MKKYYHEGDGIIRKANMNKDDFNIILSDFTYEDILIIMECAYKVLNDDKLSAELLEEINSNNEEIDGVRYRVSSWLSDEYA